ncbi:MAG: class I SAM-dependent methyltransferase [Spirochaetota bacterium]
MLIAHDWKEYELIDTGNGERLERWGEFILRRPDPQVLWPAHNEANVWDNTDAHYHRSQKGGGRWEFKRLLPPRWTISYKDLIFYIRPTDFKHTGIFPEQAVNWQWITNKIKSAEPPVKLINLFAYTGAATIAAASAGAEICHVDAAKSMVGWAKENLTLSGFADHPVRFITDDVFKFVKREKRRGRRYDALIMDPPSYGRGPDGEVWKLEDALYSLIEQCLDIMSPKPLFFLVNSYTTGFSPTVLENILKMLVQKKFGGRIKTGEVGLPVTASGLVLPCGIYGRWENEK